MTRSPDRGPARMAHEAAARRPACVSFAGSVRFCSALLSGLASTLRRPGGPRRAAVVALGLCLIAGAASADEPAADKAQRARVEFDAGREALKLSDLQGALAHFRASLALQTAPGTLLNLANVEEKLGLFASAVFHYQEALSVLPAKDERVPVARERITSIEPRIPTFRVQLQSAAPEGLTLSLDGNALPKNGLDSDVRADPGAHVLTLQAPGYKERRHDVTLHAGDRQSLVLPPLTLLTEPLPGPSATSAPVVAPTASAPKPVASGAKTGSIDRPSDSPSPGSGLRTGGIVALAVGGASAIAGGVLGGMSLARRQELDVWCTGSIPKTCPASFGPMLSEGEAFANASTALFAVAGAGVAVGVTLLVLGSRSVPVAPSVRVAVTPGGLVLRGRF